MNITNQKYKCISGSVLKLIAIVTMVIDHSAKALLVYYPVMRTALFHVGNRAVTPLYIMVSIGRIAFPIFAFLIVEGYVHTRNRFKYGRNLLLFALISEIPWNLIHSNTLFNPRQNVFFTLFFGFLGICVIERYRSDIKHLVMFLLLLLVTSIFFRADYGCQGFGFILMLYILRNSKLFAAVIGSCFLSSTWRAGLAFIPICMYNGKRGFIKGKFLKFAFYAFYPLHLLALYLLRLLLKI